MAGIGDSDIDDIGSRQGIGLLVAGTEDMASDAIEVPLFTNVVKLLEVEQKRDTIHLQKTELEKQANDVILDLFKIIFLHWVCVTIMTILFIQLWINVPSATAFAFCILLMCVFLATIFMHTYMAKLRITSINMSLEHEAIAHQRVRADARILMELEKNRKRRLAVTVDNGEGPVVYMDSFITRTKAMYSAADFPDFKRLYRKINLSWLVGAAHVVLVLVLMYFSYVTELTQGQRMDYLPPDKLRMPYTPY